MKQASTRGVLSQLRHDKSGNVLAMTAACVMPMLAFVGVGVDMSRAYLVRTRLQQACDAGVLAGRRAMGAGGSLKPDVIAEIDKYVRFNFPNGTNDTTPLGTAEPTLTAATDTIHLSLTTDMNTAIMRMFGKPSVTVSVNCSARDDYSNIDIMLVLDTTGSMACKPERNRSQCSTYAGGRNIKKTMSLNGRSIEYLTEETSGSKNISRMQALRDAVAKLRTQMDVIESQFNLASPNSRKRIRWSIVPFAMTVNAGFSTGTAGTTLYSRKPDWFNVDGRYYDGSTLRTSSHTAADGNGRTWIGTSWDGCVEERLTSNSITKNSSYQFPNNLPSTAYDLMFNLQPSTNKDTRWTVMDPGLTGTAQYACGKAMLEWSQPTTSKFTDYFKATNGFVANGGTFLDVGMLWAARMISREGLWKDDNPATYNNFDVKRYVIFMTDGVMEAGPYSYSTYGQEYYWKRVSNSGTDEDTLNDNHNKRLQMTCTAIKNMDATIFAISFSKGSDLTQDLKDCATRPAYAYKADDGQALEKVFRDIGENIGSLRLSQ